MMMISGELSVMEYADEVARDEGRGRFLSLSELKSAVSDIRDGGLVS